MGGKMTLVLGHNELIYLAQHYCRSEWPMRTMTVDVPLVT